MSMGNSAPASKDSRETDASMVGNNQFAFLKLIQHIRVNFCCLLMLIFLDRVKICRQA